MKTREASQNEAPADAAPEVPYEVREALLLALSMAATWAGTPQSCGQRQCRTTGRCHAVLDDDAEPHCHAGFTQPILDQAAYMVSYVVALENAARKRQHARTATRQRRSRRARRDMEKEFGAG